MSSQEFYNILKMIRYPNLHEYSPDSFEWIVDENPEFFQWFCNSMDVKNVLTPEEVQNYEELVKAGKAKADLREVLVDIPDEVKNEEIDNLKAKIRSVENEKQRKEKNAMDCMYRKLCLQQEQQEKRLKDAQKKLEQSEKLLQHSQQENKSANKQLVTVLTELKATLENAEKRLKDCEAIESPNRLPHLYVEEYLAKEGQFDEMIKEYLDKQFPKALPTQSFEEDLEQPETKEQEIFRKEVESVHDNYIKAHQQCMRQELENAEEVGKKIALKKVGGSLKDGTFYTEQELCARLNSIKAEIEDNNRKITPLLEKVNLMIEEDAKNFVDKLMVNRIEIVRDRRQYFMEKMEMVVEHLLLQKIHIALFSQLLKNENYFLNEFNKEVEALNVHFCATDRNARERREAMERLIAISKQISSNEDLKKLISELTPIGAKSSAQVGKKLNIFQFLAQLRDYEVKLNEEIKMTVSRQIDKISDMKTMVDNLDQSVWQDTPSTSNVPNITPKVVLDSISKLENNLSIQEKELDELITDYQKKAEQLQMNEVLSQIRNLYVDFYNSEDLTKSN